MGEGKNRKEDLVGKKKKKKEKKVIKRKKGKGKFPFLVDIDVFKGEKNCFLRKKIIFSVKKIKR